MQLYCGHDLLCPAHLCNVSQSASCPLPWHRQGLLIRWLALCLALAPRRLHCGDLQQGPRRPRLVAGAAFSIWKAWHTRWSVGSITVLSFWDMMPGGEYSLQKKSPLDRQAQRHMCIEDTSCCGMQFAWCWSSTMYAKGDCHGCECSRQQSLIEALQRGAPGGAPMQKESLSRAIWRTVMRG